MAGKIVKLSEEELVKTKLKEISSVVKAKFTQEEIDTLKQLTAEDERRKFIVSLYNKYIDEVIADSEKAAGKDETPTDSNDVSASAAPDAPAADAQNNTVETAVTDETKADKKVNINIYFTVSVRGITGYNGTITTSCEKLLLLAFRNPKTAIIQFHTVDRANQFINIVKNVKHIKGIASISEKTRADVIEQIKKVNK
jgi:hypothetical protein